MHRARINARREFERGETGKRGALVVATLAALAALAPAAAEAAACSGASTVVADVVALDQPLMFNRIGASNVNGMMFALRRDVVELQCVTDPATLVQTCTAGRTLDNGGAAIPGQVALRPDLRPRPLVLRVAAGSCLQVNLQNLLAPAANPRNAATVVNGNIFNVVVDDQVADRSVSFHAQGMQLDAAAGMANDGSFVGVNTSSLAPQGGTASYLLIAQHEGTYLVTSHGATFGGEGAAGNSGQGLFGVVNVEPAGARFYRSQVTEEEMRLATTGPTLDGKPILDYEARYPNDCGAGGAPDGVWCQEGKAGLPILNMLNGNAIVHTDLNAVIAGPNTDGSFPPDTYPLESVGKRNPTVPNRLEAFREFTVVFHDEMTVANAFPGFYNDPVLRHTLHAVGDVFMINYGSGGIGSEIIANRLGVGPMHDCLSCAYEEFFLTSHAVGDPAMVVDVPANVGLEQCAVDPQTGVPNGSCGASGRKAAKAYYPADPSNVHHSYVSDFVKFRNVHTGKEHHIFHLHNHQWLYNANDDNANYLDAQGIGPGSGYTYEINFGGSGNRNKSAGDAIFHCHFYPHFAQGMWELWRNHDTFEAGTPLAVSGGAGGFHATPYALQDGTPAETRPGFRARALPDGEIDVGTPIPGLVPLPGKGMAPLPGAVEVVAKVENGSIVGSVARVARPSGGSCDNGSALDSCYDSAEQDATWNPSGLKNPGFPFWIGGVEHTVGERPPTPPLDMAGLDPSHGGYTGAVGGGWDGGLPRHAFLGVAASGGAASFTSTTTRLDFMKELVKGKPYWYPETGTDVERAVMHWHTRTRTRATDALQLGAAPVASTFVTNGSGRPTPGAPFHEPCIDDLGNRLGAGVTGNFFDENPGGFGITGSSPFNADTPRLYKAAVIQFDAVLNKFGYHFPQERIITLWEDALPTINKTRPPEPFVMRNNTFDCTQFWHTNLVPKAYELDDYQVKTPTDVIGQHIHLPKWDLTTTDGSGNGWNYEDGTLSFEAVRERIHAINTWLAENTAALPEVPANSAGQNAGTFLAALPHPQFGAAYAGARTTMQRWFFDPVVNADGRHRGLGIIFTHDHFGPSTHQQVGLYATVLTEPAGSTWVHSETGVPLYTRHDGGPTSWQAAILTGDLDGDGQNDSHREFYFEYSDFQHAYLPGVYVGAGPDGRANGVLPDANSFRSAINPSVKQDIALAAPGANNLPDLLVLAAVCPGGLPRPCPEAISADDPGMFVVNYRNEPLALRIYDPNAIGPDGKKGAQAAGQAGDLAFALSSKVTRAIARLNVQPDGATIDGTTFPPKPSAATGFGGGNTAKLLPGDPYTPMMRVYAGDRVRVKIQAGGDEETHNVSIHGLHWLQGGSGYGFSPTSGWRNSQQAGISEQFTFGAPLAPLLSASPGGNSDYAYTMDASYDGWWTGVWGILRAFNKPQNDLWALPNNQCNVAKNAPCLTVSNLADFALPNNRRVFGVCPTAAPERSYDVSAVLANDALANGVGATIPTTGDVATQVGRCEGTFPSCAQFPLNPAGGTLVYNPRTTALNNGKSGPLHDPSAILYVLTSDLDAAGKLKPGAPLEPLVLRAAAGECLRITLRNRLPATVPDLASYNSLLPIVIRDAVNPQGVTTFNVNLFRPSSWVGLMPGLVEFNVAKDQGFVGTNGEGAIGPGGTIKYDWYAGHLSMEPSGTNSVKVVATPVEFGGANLFPADKIKQGRKSLGGALVVEPPGSSWNGSAAGTPPLDVTVDHQVDTLLGFSRQTRASATVTRGPADPQGAGTTFRDFSAVFQKGVHQYYADGSPVENIAAEGVVPEDGEDSGQMAINYGSEPLWYRFGYAANSPFNKGHGVGPGLSEIPNAHEAYSNVLTAGADPATPVFLATAGREFRLRLTEPAGAGRASVFNLHGHVWQRAPYMCPGSSHHGLPGNCEPMAFNPTLPGFEVGSKAIGHNPLSMYLGGQDSVLPAGHFDFVLPSAGGVDAVPGDYLFKDQASFGNLGGLWGIVRVPTP